tara:strand:+ start:84 stop:425 length:342 start_codon:yes stop_codon:yes gene_type:complete
MGYKWNISKEKGKKILEETIISILKENIDNLIDIDELSFLINSRTKNIVIRNNNKIKNMMNYVKNNLGGLINFVENNNKLIIKNISGNIYISLKNPNYEINLLDWIIIDENSY